ncbi:hypothetical protein LJC43_07300 [Parabacteroides sp. OttesenSCG-928-G21]|jgi:hypothetical protein|nr:hypothetical protein [Parabacteroides sp. OttesenSCG-928-G21]
MKNKLNKYEKPLVEIVDIQHFDQAVINSLLAAESKASNLHEGIKIHTKKLYDN